MRCAYPRFVLVVALLVACGAPAAWSALPSWRFWERGASPAPAAGAAFHPRWWNYERRGYERLAAGRPDEAIADFETAVALRPADTWRARTYGLHFTEYFPERGLGMAWLAKKDYDKAIMHLRLSLASCPSAKAEFFLRKAETDRTLDAGRDLKPPLVTFLLSSLPEEPGEDDRIRVRFRVSDDGYVAAVSLNGAPLAVPPLSPEAEFAERLPAGTAAAVVEAVDGTGKAARLEVPLRLDGDGPRLEITGLEPAGDAVSVRVTATDGSGVGAVACGDLAGSGNGAREARLAWLVPRAAFTEPVYLVATDGAGNRSRTLVPWIEMPAPPAEGAPPQIETPFADTVATSLSHFAFEAVAIGMGAEIAAVSLNGAPVAFRPGRVVEVRERVRLGPGENRFTVEVTDAARRASRATVVVTRREFPSAGLSSRATLALLPLADPEAEGAAGAALQAQFLQERRFRLVERSRLDAVLKEQELSASLLADKASALKLGRLLSARYSLAGEARRAKDFELVCRLVDNETGEVLAVVDAYAPGAGREEMQNAAALVALGVAQRLPLLDGRVSAVRGDLVALELPAGVKPLPGMDFLLLRRGEALTDPLTGEVILPAEETVVAEARFESPGGEGALCRLSAGPGKVVKGDMAVAR